MEKEKFTHIVENLRGTAINTSASRIDGTKRCGRPKT